MADRPILFSTPMIKALLAGTKSQTRRALKQQPPGHVHRYGWYRDRGAEWASEDQTGEIPIWAGDRLWVKEALRADSNDQGYRWIVYDTDGEIPAMGGATAWPWKRDILSPRFMPKWASRITLLVDDVKIERLQDISEEDAIAEGVVDMGRRDGEPYSHCHIPGVPSIRVEHDAVPVYSQLWEMINGEGSWAANPFVAAYSFKVVLENIDYIGRAAA